MAERRLIIGICVRYAQGDKRYWLDQSYASLADDLQCIPVFLKCDDESLVDDYLSIVDGIILTGGESIEPHRYGGSADPDYHLYQPKRDAFEHRLVRAARERAIPVFGICRGCQVIVSALGGGLISDLSIHDGYVQHRIDLYSPSIHTVAFQAASSFYDPQQSNTKSVLSLHTQGLSRELLPTSLQVCAVAEDGTVEAVESRSGSYVIGVMWHPEREERGSVQGNRRLFERFLKECARCPSPSTD